MNRNRLLAVNGPPFYITIPVPRKRPSKIKDIQLKSGSWRRKLLKSIYFNYKRSPHFEEIYPLLETIIQCETDSLSNLNKTSIIQIANYLKIATNILTDLALDELEEKLVASSADRASAFPDIHLSDPSVKVIRVIEICRSLKAETFVNPIGGTNLYPKEEFIRNNINIMFLNMGEVRYKQNSRSFYPRLSIIDVLMNCGKEGTFELLKEYVLV